MTQNRRHSPLIWTDHWRPIVASPRQSHRLAELGALFDLLGLIGANWSEAGRAEEKVPLDYPMLLAATRWFCGLSLPASLEDIMFGRRSSLADATWPAIVLADVPLPADLAAIPAAGRGSSSTPTTTPGSSWRAFPRRARKPSTAR